MTNILVLCTGNSARSILAEAILNRDGAGRIQGFSAGSNPAGLVNAATLRLLGRKGLPTIGYRSKNWQEFAAPGAPGMDLIITLCPATAAERAPRWIGNPAQGLWPMDDPAAAPPDQIDLAFQVAYHRLSARINAFLALPFEAMSRSDMTMKLQAIGER